MNTTQMSIDTASVLRQCFEHLNSKPSPPVGLLIGLDGIRRGLADIGRIVVTTDMTNAANIEIFEILQQLCVIRVARTEERSCFDQEDQS